MSVRAVIIAVAGAVFIAAVGYINDQVARLGYFVSNLMPVIVFFPLVLAAALWNPLAGRLWARWRLRRAELAAIVALTLVACNIPSGVLRFFSRNMVMPVHANHTRVDWQRAGALERVPSYLLAGDGQFDPAFLQSVVEGSGGPMALSEIPWGKWLRPLSVWTPLVVLLSVASICLALIVHRTWSQRERLPYPMAQLAGSLMAGGEAHGPARPLYRNRLFLIGMGIVLAIHLANGINKWTDGQFIQVPLTLSFRAFQEKFPEMRQVPWSAAMLDVFIFPSAIAVACLVATDVSFSVGACFFVWFIVGSGLVAAGVNFQEDYPYGGGILPWQTAGSAAAMALILVYLGRRFYRLLLVRALGLGAGGEVEPHEVWACRVFLLSVAALAVLLTAIGLTWYMSLLIVGLILLGFVVIARINVESGLFLIQTKFQPLGVIIGIFGAEALGLRMLAILGMLSAVFALDRRVCLMPFALNAMRVLDTSRLRPGRAGLSITAVFLIALAVAIPVGLWADHSFGLLRGERYATQFAPTYAFTKVAREHRAMSVMSGSLERSEAMTGWQRIANMKPDRTCVIAMIAGAVGVLVLYRLRLRFTWWPLHPIMLIVWCVGGTYMIAYSFLIGWAIKTSTFRFGIRPALLRTFMMGVIVGDLAAAAIWMAVGAVYWLATGEAPKLYGVFPLSA